MIQVSPLISRYSRQASRFLAKVKNVDSSPARASISRALADLNGQDLPDCAGVSGCLVADRRWSSYLALRDQRHKLAGKLAAILHLMKIFDCLYFIL